MNVVSLKCAAEYLQMSEDFGEGNLVAQDRELPKRSSQFLGGHNQSPSKLRGDVPIEPVCAVAGEPVVVVAVEPVGAGNVVVPLPQADDAEVPDQPAQSALDSDGSDVEPIEVDEALFPPLKIRSTPKHLVLVGDTYISHSCSATSSVMGGALAIQQHFHNFLICAQY
ncbi:PREDICTED: uncharacterized protein LOC109172313 isoform X2 [Ipomoea nil]|uniref:uncharacterized protein LOC109172313 isoform X2 n=1 Tax=Ipomoea nil TaxID=35883 RepID=UPI000901736A|nr:PREDICTED: uncharacterized protein LOC109172313 isoform X2 [Ipomoea nil]XP_019177042.1 PREDICTED: uncharacterized protein LOC109172313 isoform X2 [Ipomoea nil]XP_019177043.1 PREDICTED: uncharacterized protein LOC109172313 isoform X2 [Ipomoea nil]